jgi:hypothetical protein
MKGPEIAFLQIMQSIQENYEVGINKLDVNENIFTNVLNCSKNLENKTRYLCKKSDAVHYVFEGAIELDELYTLRYYFSNKRSYISLDPSSGHWVEDKIPYMQLNTLKYTELLYKYYNIDEFVYNFINN